MKCLLFFTAAEELGMGETLPSTPTELSQYPKLCELRRKFPVLYRVEFQVRPFVLQNYMALKGLVLRTSIEQLERKIANFPP